MRGTNRNNAIRFESLEEALAQNPETYRHIDLLCGGWPCQDNSIAGKREGHAGEKSGLWKEMRRLIGLFRPRWIIAENVPGLFSVNNGKDFWGVISDLDSIGHCVAWRVLDSRFFGVAQRRRRVFIVASFGNLGASKVLFEPEGDCRNHKKKYKMGEIGLCISTRDGERQDPTNETLVGFTLGTDLRGQPYKLHTETLVANTIRVNRDGEGSPFKIAGETLIAKINSKGKGEATRISQRLDSLRGVVIGNAVTVSVAEWIGKRIVGLERGTD